MSIQKTHAAVLALAAALATTTPSFAKSHSVAHVDAAHQAVAYQPGDDTSTNVVNGHFAPGATGFGRWEYNPEQPTDPDPRIGGALKMRTDR